MKVIVTGGSGLIGGASIDAMLAQGWTPVSIDVKPSGRDITEYLVDIRDQEAVDQVFATEQPQAVLHLAAQIRVTESVVNPAFDMQVNVAGAVHVFEAARRHGVQRVVYASSAAIYGNAQVPISEAVPMLPTSPYGISKMTAEIYLTHFYRDFFQYGVLRYANAYGTAQSPETGAVIANFVRDGLFRGEVHVFGDGGQLRDFVHVKDLAQLNLLALKDERNFTANIGSGVPVSILEIVRMVEEATGRSIRVIHHATRPGDIYASYYDVSHMHELLQWRPAVSLREGIGSIVAELLEMND